MLIHYSTTRIIQTLVRLLLLCVVGLGAVGPGAAGAQAQLVLPGAQVPTQSGATQAPPRVAPPGVNDRLNPLASPLPPKATSMGNIIDRDLKLNGKDSLIRIARTAKPGARPNERLDFSAQVLLEGKSIARPGEPCAVDLGGDAGIPLTQQSQGSGVTRYALEAPVCPIVFDVVDGAILVTGPSQACQFINADCQIDVRGLWGPEARNLTAQANQYEQARGKADTAVREGYKLLIAKAGPGQTRSIVSEQASFSSERETVCRNYAGEDRHGFCHLKFTEARDAVVRMRAHDGPAVLPAR